MAKAAKFHVITANALIEGDVIYLTASSDWSLSLQEARVFENIHLAEEALISASTQTDRAVGVYVTDVDIIDGQITTTHFREEFRRRGPSNYFHGKQESQKNV